MASDSLWKLELLLLKYYFLDFYDFKISEVVLIVFSNIPSKNHTGKKSRDWNQSSDDRYIIDKYCKIYPLPQPSV